MKDKNFRQGIREIIEKDSRYPAPAYEFISDAVNYTAKKLMRHNQQDRHISGEELLQGICEYAIDQYGPMAEEVLKDWGISSGPSVGNVVYNMIDRKLLRASDDDSIEDFNVEFDFSEELRKPFETSSTRRKKTNPPIIA